MTVTLTPRPLTASEIAAGWAYAYECSPRISPRILTVFEIADPMSDPSLAETARIIGATFVLAK